MKKNRIWFEFTRSLPLRLSSCASLDHFQPHFCFSFLHVPLWPLALCALWFLHTPLNLDRHWWWNQYVHLQMSMFQLKNCQCQWTKVASEVRSTSMSVPFVFLDSHTVVHKNFFSSGVSLKFLRENIQSKQPELCFMPLCCLAPAHRWISWTCLFCSQCL